MAYQLNFNLRQRAAVRAAISFWEKKEVKDRVTKFFESCDEFEKSEAKDEWRQFTKAVVDECYEDELPKTLEVELIHIVKMIGETIYNWYQHIKHENVSQYGMENKAMNYIDKIYWTFYGTVDGVETLKSSWAKNPNLNAAKIYNMACSYGLEEYVNDLWNEIPNNVQVNYYHDIYNYFNRHILAYWKYCRDDNLPNLIRHLEEVARNSAGEYMEEFYVLYEPNGTIEENMLRLSVYQGYSTAAKYFWSKLTEEERNRNILGCAQMTVKNYNYYERRNYSIEDYIKGQYVEICIFLMNQMTTSHKKSFFNETIRLNIPYSFHVEIIDVRDGVLKMLLSTWPWQKLFIPVLKDILQFQDCNSEMVCTFLDAITNKMVEDHELGYSVENSEYRSLLREVWLILPASIKQNTVREDLRLCFICDLIDVWDMSSLKLILNDPAIAAVRDEFIDFGLDSYEQLIIEDQFEMLDQFIDEIFRSKEEKESFKQTINVWNVLINNNQFHLLDKLLDWQCVTPEEKQSIKNSIDHMGLCKDLIEIEQYDAADNLLNWKFETEEERKKCKDHFKSDVFSIKLVYEIWERCRRNTDEAKEKSSQFLRWFLESEKEIARFKKDKIVNFEMDETLGGYLFKLDNIGSINNFMNWCSLSKKVMHKIRRMVFLLRQRQRWMFNSFI